MGYILGLDASTSKVGVTLFSEENGIAEMQVIIPTYNGSESSKLASLYHKCSHVANTLKDMYNLIKIDTIVIEESLPMSKQAETFVSLKYYNEHLRYCLEKNFNVPVQVVSVDESRRYGLPMLLGLNKSKKQVLFGGFCEEVVKNKKFAILYCVSRLFPKISWRLNKNGFIHEDNLDCADSVSVVLSYLHQNNVSKFTLDIPKAEIENFVTLNVQYEKLKSSKLDKMELKEEKKRFLYKLNSLIKLSIDERNSVFV